MQTAYPLTVWDKIVLSLPFRRSYGLNGGSGILVSSLAKSHPSWEVSNANADRELG